MHAFFRARAAHANINAAGTGTAEQHGTAENPADGFLTTNIVRPAFKAGLRLKAQTLAVAAWIERSLVLRLVTVSFHDGILRVVVFRRGRAIGWRTVRLGEGDAGSISRGSLADALKLTLREMRPGRHRMVVDLPFYAPLIRSFTLKKIGRSYLDKVITTEVLDSIPFEEAEVDLSWASQKVKGALDVLAVAIPKGVTDEVFASLRQARLRTHFALAQALSLALATGVREGTAAWVDRSSALIVRSVGGVPVAISEHRIEDATASALSKAESLANAILQVADRGPSSRSSGTRPRGSRLVHVVGATEALDLLQQVRQRLATAPGTRIEPVGDVDPEDYLLNAGMSLARSKGIARTGILLPNLLPERYLPWRLPIRPIAAFVGLSLLAISGLNLAPVVELQEEALLPLQSQIADLARDQRIKTLQLRRIMVLQEETVKTRQFGEALAFNTADVYNEQNQRFTRLDIVTSYQDRYEIELIGVNETADRFNLAGTAASSGAVLEYAAALLDSGQFSSVDVLDMTFSGQEGSGSGRVRFQIRASIQEL